MRVVARVMVGLLLLGSAGAWVWAFQRWGLTEAQASDLSGLASSVLGGAVVAVAVLFLEGQARAREAASTAQRETEASRRALHLRVQTYPQPSKLSLIGAELQGIPLPHTNFSAANFSRCDLTGADLSRGTHIDIRLTDAILTGASFSDSTLTGAKLTGAKAEKAIFALAKLDEAALDGADLTGADLSGADLRRASLIGAHLENAVLIGADVRGANFQGAVLTGAMLDGARSDSSTIGIPLLDEESS